MGIVAAGPHMQAGKDSSGRTARVEVEVIYDALQKIGYDNTVQYCEHYLESNEVVFVPPASGYLISDKLLVRGAAADQIGLAYAELRLYHLVESGAIRDSPLLPRSDTDLLLWSLPWCIVREVADSPTSDPYYHTSAWCLICAAQCSHVYTPTARLGDEQSSGVSRLQVSRRAAAAAAPPETGAARDAAMHRLQPGCVNADQCHFLFSVYSLMAVKLLIQLTDR
nr:hypothetical protein CFP56_24663 [Quercus suber]